LETQNLKKFYSVLKEVPDLPLIFSHGGIYQAEEVIELMKMYPKTYVEISTQPPERIKQFIKEVGSERILYGTDYPAFNHAFSIVSVLRATGCDKERRNIYSNNAKRLLGI
jgi:predicted TIM-barrel fold metal-dependent hydrolase